MKAPEIRHRDQIEAFCAQEAERLGHAVLLLPVANPLSVPESMPPGLVRKDREGRALEASRLVAFAPEFAFDVAAGLSLSFNDNDGRVGTHLSEIPGDFVSDLMSKNPNKVHGDGHMFILDGYGWVAENHDLLLTTGARFHSVTGELSLLGVGIVGLDDLEYVIRRVTDPAMEHYQEPVPIGF